MDPFPPRLGYCCMFRAPDADPLQERRFNVSGTTVTALQRMDRLDAFEKVLALVSRNLAVMEAHGRAHGDDPVATAVGKIVRVLPENVARPFEALRQVAARRTDPDPPHPETTATLVRASADQSTRDDGWPGGRCPETTVKEWTTPRWVIGTPAAPGTETALVTPGTTSQGMPCSRQTCSSSKPRPKT